MVFGVFRDTRFVGRRMVPPSRLVFLPARARLGSVCVSRKVCVLTCRPLRTLDAARGGESRRTPNWMHSRGSMLGAVRVGGQRGRWAPQQPGALRSGRGREGRRAEGRGRGVGVRGGRKKQHGRVRVVSGVPKK